MGLFSGFGLAFLGFLVAGPFPRGVGASSCPAGWKFYQGSCYGFIQDKLTWEEAETDCRSRACSGHLASITSQAEGAMLARHIQSSQQECVHVWIGLHDPQKNGRWRWSDRSLVNFKAWLAGMPDNYKQEEYCAHLRCQEGYVAWNDLNCKTQLAYLCKYDP